MTFLERSKSKRKRFDLLVAGYIRSSRWLRKMSSDIVLLCRLYYSSDLEVQFNTILSIENGCTCIFSNDNKTVETQGKNIIAFDCMISGNDCNICEWEVTMDKIGYYSYLGFFDAPLNIAMEEKALWTSFLTTGDHENHYAICIYKPWEEFHVYWPNDGSNTVNIPREILGRSSFENGDCLKFRIDFHRKQCDLYCNDKLLAKNCFHGFGNIVIPVVCSSGKTAQYTIGEVSVF